jgi:hypothetical protein
MFLQAQNQQTTAKSNPIKRKRGNKTKKEKEITGRFCLCRPNLPHVEDYSQRRKYRHNHSYPYQGIPEVIANSAKAEELANSTNKIRHRVQLHECLKPIWQCAGRYERVR